MTDLGNDEDMAAFLTRHGLNDGTPVHGRVLTGGVSSRVIRVDTNGRRLVVKQALPELTVGDGWYADVARSVTEAHFAALLEELVPGASPRVLAVDEDLHTFVMSHADDTRTWKHDLLDGRVDREVAARVGALFGELHAQSVRHPRASATFADTSHFESLRLDPYLRHVQRRHPDLSAPLQQVIDLLTQPGRCLVHGDASPKNLLLTPSDDVLLIDHEVAHWGQPAFDTAFLVNHLCLKSIARPRHAVDLLDAAETLLESYAAHSGSVGATRRDTARVLAPLLLARVDGRSPVEYLDHDQRAAVRHLAHRLLRAPSDLDTFLVAVREQAASPTERPDA